MSKNPTVELKLPILKNMELIATQTAEVVSKHMNLSEEKSGEISQDQKHMFETQIQKITDELLVKIDDIFLKKEKEWASHRF